MDERVAGPRFVLDPKATSTCAVLLRFTGSDGPATGATRLFFVGGSSSACFFATGIRLALGGSWLIPVARRLTGETRVRALRGVSGNKARFSVRLRGDVRFGGTGAGDIGIGGGEGVGAGGKDAGGLTC